MEVRHRKTGEKFEVASDHSLIALKTQSMFRKPTDYSVLEEFLQHFKSILPPGLAANEKEKMVKKLRHECKNNKEMSAMIHHPQTLSKLMDDVIQQIKPLEQGHTDSTSMTTFLKLLGKNLVAAKLDSIFPGLSLLLTFPNSAAANSIYTYFAGQPKGGENLCAAEQAFQDCIQGYVTELGREWQNNMPQGARIFEALNGSEASTCGTQEDLKAMMLRAYRPSTQPVVNCTLNEMAANGDVTVKATNFDTISCNIARDSLVGITEKCPMPLPPAPPAPEPSQICIDKKLAIYIGGGVGGVCVLAFLAFTINKCVQRHRQQDGLVQPNTPTYGAINASA